MNFGVLRIQPRALATVALIVLGATQASAQAQNQGGRGGTTGGITGGGGGGGSTSGALVPNPPSWLDGEMLIL